MGRSIGGSRITGGLEALRSALYDYYGAINELKTLSEAQPNLASTVKIPQKPEALILWEQCQALGLPLVDGGLEDQPHIWIEEVAVIRDAQQEFQIRG